IHRDQAIEEWVSRLHEEVSHRYSRRPLKELWNTVTKAFDASSAVVLFNDYSLIDAHIEWIARKRLEGGFFLSDVQNAYELFRTVLTPVLVRELKGRELLKALQGIDTCLIYTIKKFSNYYQSLHEKDIRAHAGNLEREVKKRTGELAESEAKYRVLVEEINDGYFVNQKGRIVFANQAFYDLHGFAPGEMFEKPYTDFVAPVSLPLVQRWYKKSMAGESSDELYVYQRRHKNGAFFFTENKVKRILFRGKFAMAGICRDITERIETEKRIREAERLAHLGKLTASLAHEIRNPLSSVKMNSQIILKNTKFGGNDQRRLEIIVQEISRLERILDEMLDFARPVKLQLVPVSINAVVDASLEVMETRIREKGITVKKRYARKLPLILLDHEKMEQAVINVLLNAVEALSSRGQIEIVTKTSGKGKKTLEVEISDNGPGISPEDLPYVFDPFFSTKKKGTGLGLFNVKKIMEAHGGDEKFSLLKPHGNKVSLIFPLVRK
ncbi:MAG TPA: ATP-binding protein, partial [Thermodesulfobacteriota bacterium]|nr:ATP-binding protein [Thermodesulfobacteriota bacterium]